MLDSATMYAVFPAKDVERLKKFFSEKLGLEPVQEQMGMPFYDVGESNFSYMSRHMPAPTKLRRRALTSQVWMRSYKI